MNNTETIDRLHLAMIRFDRGDARRIQHFTKVWAYAMLIAKEEHLSEEMLFIVESAALVHDIGIHIAEQKYGHQNGKLQEQEGPIGVRQILEEVGGYTASEIERICWLVAHHHTYNVCDDLDYQILIEADFLVNLFEDGEPKDVAHTVADKIFKTHTGKTLLEDMFIEDYTFNAKIDNVL